MCRQSLITILSQVADKVNEKSRLLLDKDELRTRLDDLIHNNHMVAVHHSLYLKETKHRTESQEQVTDVLKLLAQSELIKKFLVNDMFKRAEETLKISMENDFEKFCDRNVRLTSYRSAVKLEAILDPYNLILLSKMFLEIGFIANDQIPSSLVAFVDLCFVYAIMFISDKHSLVSLELLDHVIYLFQAAVGHIHLFAGK